MDSELITLVDRIILLERRVTMLRAVLKEIADEDFRGNRPYSASLAEKALREDEAGND